MTSVDFTTVVDLPHSPRVAFTYLIEPRNRPQWQASLLSVRLDERDAEPAVGMKWRDTTMTGVKPRMEITELVPYRVFAEVGRWGGIEGLLTMRFVATATGCRLTTEGTITGSGPWAIAVRAAGLLAAKSVRSDLLRASRILSDTGPA